MNLLATRVEQCAGLLLGVVALITVAEVCLRQFLGVQVPDAYTLAGYSQGIAIFWGIAIALLAGRHITVDILWTLCTQRWRFLIDVFATIISALAMGALTYMMTRKVGSTYASGETTYELGMALWPVMLCATVGAGFGVVLCLLRLQQLARQFTGPATDSSKHEPT